jgi:hypothetical protein
MSLDLVPSVQIILDEVKNSTGKAVEFIEKDNLATYAKVKIARENMPNHIIFYGSRHNELINHLIAHECGHILRIFKVSEEKRLIPMSDQDSRTKVVNDLAGDLSRLSSFLPPRDILKMVDIWHHGIISQLTNYPPDIMIEKWIHSNYSDLRPFQRRSIMNQHADAIKALSPQICQSTPSKIYDATIIMHVAFFSILGSILKLNLLKPYKAYSYLKKGKELSSITEKNYVDSYVGDIAMIDYWASFLGLNGWFKWTNFEDMPVGYLDSI